jgi:hypothetical protein
MTDRYLENLSRIADYLEDRMSAAEEEAFVQALGEEEDLRFQYEEELVMRGRMRGAAGEAGLIQAADEHLEMVSRILAKEKEAGRAGRKEGARIALIGRSGMVAAALLVIIAGTVLYLRIGRRGGSERVGPAAASAPDFAKAAANGPATGARSGDSLFARNYRPYSSNADPVEVSLYYSYYKKGEYALVLKAREEDYQVMGVGGREKVLKRYMQLYKGLSYLAEGKAAEAIGMFGAVQPGDADYDAAQWYSALAWVKLSNLERAAFVAAAIANSPSRYKERAAKLLKDLRS